MSLTLLEILLLIIGTILHKYINFSIEFVVSMMLIILGTYSLLTGKSRLGISWYLNGWGGRLIGIMLICIAIYGFLQPSFTLFQ